MEEEYVLAIMIAVHGGSQGPRTQDHQRTVASILSRLGPEHPPLRPMVSVLWALSTGPTDTDVELQERLMGQDPWSLALRHLGWGYVRMAGGDVAGAEAEFAAGIVGFRAIGDRWGLAGMLAAQAGLAADRGEDEHSLALADEAFELVRQLGAAEDMAYLLSLRAEGMARAGDFAQAYACYERAGELARRSGAPETVAQVRHGLGELARMSGDLAGARRRHESALSACTTESYGVREVQARVLVSLGRVAEAEGDAAEAGSRYREALTVSPGDLRAVASVAEGLAGVALFDDDGERAALLLGAGLALRGMSVAGDPDVARTSRRARELLGDAAYTSAHDRGAAMSREEILALIEPVPPAR
jgi:tetratricopeptide (TPR) repeat protein